MSTEKDIGAPIVGPKYAVVPEWIIYSDISANAVRLYATLARHLPNVHPGRRRVAELMHVSPDTVDRARAELEAIGAVIVKARHEITASGRERQTTHEYVIAGDTPLGTDADTPLGTDAHAPSAPVPTTPSAPVPTKGVQEQGVQLKESSTQASDDAPSVDLLIDDLCEKLATAIAHFRDDPASRPDSRTTRWRNDMRLLLQRGPLGRASPAPIGPERIAKAIGVVFGELADREPGGFCWAAQILSPRALREHWDQLSVAAKALHVGAQPTKTNVVPIGAPRAELNYSEPITVTP